MADLIINLETSLPASCARKSPGPRGGGGGGGGGRGNGNEKHRRFVRRRHFLERKGFLKQKQLQLLIPSTAAAATAVAPLPRRDAASSSSSSSAGAPGQERGKKRQKGGGSRGSASWEDGSPLCRTKALPGEESPAPASAAAPTAAAAAAAHGAKDPVARSCCPLSGAPSAAGKTGSGSGSSKAVSRVSLLLSEYESGLPSAPAPAKPSSKMVAIDCEMVGTGPGGRNSDLARCSVVTYYGDVIYDKYIRPLSPITNYRTRWSGIRRHHMNNAIPFKVAQKEILKLLSGKIVIGHAIHNDFKALKYFHPKSLTRDTSRIPLLNRKAGFPETESASLKRLTKQLLHRDIQVGQNGHSSVEDARATMELYKVIEMEWERHLASCPPQD